MNSELVGAIATVIVLVCVTTVLPLGLVYLRRSERVKARHQLPESDIVARLERMEVGMESMSTEIERIGEGQRFTTKLLQTNSERPERLPREGT
ncbi:MAG: hypothetical protein ABI229_00905 [Gemmatimonadaceae bacterium]